MHNYSFHEIVHKDVCNLQWQMTLELVSISGWISSTRRGCDRKSFKNFFWNI